METRSRKAADAPGQNKDSPSASEGKLREQSAQFQKELEHLATEHELERERDAADRAQLIAALQAVNTANEKWMPLNPPGLGGTPQGAATGGACGNATLHHGLGCCRHHQTRGA